MKSSTMVSALLPVFLTISFYACRSSQPAFQSEPSVKPREALISAMRAKLNAKSYRMKMVQSNPMMNSVIEGDYVAPDRYRMVGETAVENRQSGRREMVFLGKDAFIKSPAGKWQKQEVDQQKVEFMRWRDEMLIENLAKISDNEVTFVGREELEGAPMFVFQHSFGGTSDAATGSKTKTWVGVKDGLPYKIEMDAWVRPGQQRMTVKTTTIYYDYNATIVIQPPM